MLKQRIIPCLDVKEGKVVKGIQFKNHEIVGDIEALAKYYSSQGADELVFYDITASSDQRDTDISWIRRVACVINIPFCVAGGIRTIESAEAILNAGADKISINSPAIENPEFITQLARRFGQQCVVVGIDSFAELNQYHVYQYTGDPTKSSRTSYLTLDWINEVCQRGAGEIVLNCMNQDGMRHGYDIEQLNALTSDVSIPVIASGGAGTMENFYDVFSKADVNGALAASVFHKKIISIPALKQYLNERDVRIRL